MINIIHLLKLNNMTFKKLSESTGYSVAYLSYLAHGHRKNPSFECLNKIASALNVDVPILLGGDYAADNEC